MRSMVAVLVAGAMSGGCGDDDCCAMPDAMGPIYEELARVPLTMNRDIDILFVIDDSPGGLEQQTALKADFPNFINVLNTIEGGLPNVHIGVVSTDLGTTGAADNQAGPGIGMGPGSCSGQGKAGNLQTNGTTLVNGNFINDQNNGNGTRTKNYTGTLEAAFSAVASLGAAGCGFEQPLEAAKRALNGNPSNPGFLRPTANLALVFVTDEDDCSLAHSTMLGNDEATLGPLQSFRCTRFGVTCAMGGKTSDEMNTIGTKTGCHSNDSSPYMTSVAQYVTNFKSLKNDPALVMVGTITGPPSPFAVELRTPPGGGVAVPALAQSCQSGLIADPAVRMTDFANGFRHASSSICGNFSTGLIDVARQARLQIGSACLPGTGVPTDRECEVVEQHGTSSETKLPACGGGAMPCWEVVANPQACITAPNLQLNVQRSEAPPLDTVVVLRCKL